MKKILLPAHPAMKKFNELCDKAAELGIDLTFHNAQAVTITVDGQTFMIEDIEGRNHLVESFPPVTEFKITYEKEEVTSG